MSLPTEPYSRIERYLAKIAGQDVDIPDKPITRIECYLDYIVNNGGGGGGGGYTPAPNAGAHNAIFRGQSLGTEFTADQSAAITGGTFEDLYIGDYWTIGEKVYRIAGFDTFYHYGDSPRLETHHAVVMPDAPMVGQTVMNDTATTAGGYSGAQIRSAVLPDLLTIIETAFGSSHVLSRRTRLVNTVSNGVPSASTWATSKLELPTESMVIGRGAFGSHAGNGFNVGDKLTQLPLFMLEPQYIPNDSKYWLQDIVSDTSFSYITNTGIVYHATANALTSVIGVRPYFCIA